MDFANITPPYAPSAWLDLSALEHNIAQVNKTTQAVKLRIASKSIRSIDVLQYIKERTPHFIGIMSYSAEESLYLIQQGFDDILCAYPSLDSEAIANTIPFIKKGAKMVWMVDSLAQWQLLEEIGKTHNSEMSVCLDINMSMPLPKLYFGTKRSALMSLNHVKKLLKDTQSFRYSKVTALMGYEAQIAGLPESLPNKTYLASVIRLLKKASKRQLASRRQTIVEWLTNNGYELDIVNGGGSGSINFTTAQSEITEITVGSAYYYPAMFSYMDSMQAFSPAAGFVLQVTRQPENHVVTCHSGGFVASGAGGIDKQPKVVFPSQVKTLVQEGYGEVQTPFEVKSNTIPGIGSYVWCQHAKAGELCEHFNELIAYQNNIEVRRMVTYRGAGKCFH